MTVELIIFFEKKMVEYHYKNSKKFWDFFLLFFLKKVFIKNISDFFFLLPITILN